MLQVFKAVKITYRQKGGIYTAESHKYLEANLEKAIHILNTEA